MCAERNNSCVFAGEQQVNLKLPEVICIWAAWRDNISFHCSLLVLHSAFWSQQSPHISYLPDLACLEKKREKKKLN